MNEYTTKELVDELKKRKGVEEVFAEVEDRYDIEIGDSRSSVTTFGLGPARILIIID
ncbi:BC1881 family protein [Macrococcoides bohemicum]|uniref:BC1881 family protein n=1 Tax=Macrococcoides bohemicum TaxID=1903056 RepID=UPI00105AAD4B|nr:BC1881 family protein [Macrococcus bohemicus]TDL40594.1 BC1881 family protein [Macrococcus bohemicus]